MLKRLSIALLMLLPLSAHADTWTVYGYANTYILADVFNAVSMWMSNGDYYFLCMAIALIGLLGSSVMGFMGGSPSKFAGYLLFISVGVWVMFNVRVDLHIEDMVYGKVAGTAAQFTNVPNVPAIAGLPIAMLSEVGMEIANAIDTVFTTPNEPSMSNGVPFGGAFGVVADLTKFRITNQYLRYNLTQFMRYCFVPYTSVGWFDVNQMYSSRNFWDAIGANSWQAVNQYIPMYSSVNPDAAQPHPIVMAPCSDVPAGYDVPPETGAWTLINAQIQAVVPAQIAKTSGGSLVAGMANMGYVENMGEWATGSATGATDLAMNNAMRDMTLAGFKQAAMATGSDGLLYALNLDNARRAQKSGWATTAALFRDMAGYFFSILQVFIIALTPIVAIMAFLPGIGSKIIMGYGKVLLWLMLWWPGLAIVNFIMLSYYKNSIGEAGALCLAGAVSNPSCVNAIGTISQATDNMALAAGLMATFVPAILWGIVSQGSFALTSVLDRASGSGYATQAGESIAHGSARFGDVSLNNVNANKHDTTERNATGIEASRYSASAGQNIKETNMGGNLTKKADQTATVSYDQTLTQKAAQASAHKTATAAEASESSKASLNEAYSTMSSLLNSGTHQEGNQRVWNDQAAYDAYKDLAGKSTEVQKSSNDKSVQDMSFEKWANEHSVAGKQAAAITASGGVSLNPLDWSFGVKASASTELARIDKETTGDGGQHQTTTNAAHGTAASNDTSSTVGAKSSHQTSGGRSGSDGMSTAEQAAINKAHNVSNSLDKSVSLNQKATTAAEVSDQLTAEAQASKKVVTSESMSPEQYLENRASSKNQMATNSTRLTEDRASITAAANDQFATVGGKLQAGAAAAGQVPVTDDGETVPQQIKDIGGQVNAGNQSLADTLNAASDKNEKANLSHYAEKNNAALHEYQGADTPLGKAIAGSEIEAINNNGTVFRPVGATNTSGEVVYAVGDKGDTENPYQTFTLSRGGEFKPIDQDGFQEVSYFSESGKRLGDQDKGPAALNDNAYYSVSADQEGNNISRDQAVDMSKHYLSRDAGPAGEMYSDASTTTAPIASDQQPSNGEPAATANNQPTINNGDPVTMNAQTPEVSDSSSNQEPKKE